MRPITAASIRRSALFSVVSCLFFLPATAFGTAANRPSLGGLKGVYVLVEKLDPAVEEDGLTSDRIRGDVAAQLHRAGIEVLSKAEWYDAPGMPCLHVNLHVVKLPSSGEYIYSLDVGFEQDVYLSRKPIFANAATTWSLGLITGITHRLSKISESLKTPIASFVSDYLSANRK